MVGATVSGSNHASRRCSNSLGAVLRAPQWSASGTCQSWVLGISGVDDLRMAHGNVAIDLAVNQENRDRRGGDGIFRGNILHVEVILQAGAEEGDFD